MARRRIRRWSLAVALTVAAALGACSSAPHPGSTPAPTRPGTPAARAGATTARGQPGPLTPWGGSVVSGAAAHAVPVLAFGKSVYAVGDRRLFRLDAATGSVAADVSLPDQVGLLSDAVVAAAILWLSPTTDAAGRAVLNGYNPATLAPVARIVLPAARSAGADVLPLAVSPDGRRLYVALPHTVVGIDPVRRTITRQTEVTGGPLIDVAVSADSRRLYVAAQPPAPRARLDALDANTGALLFSRPSENNIVNNIGLVSSAGGLWVQTAGGMSDHVTFYRGDSLRGPARPDFYARIGGRPITVTVSGPAVWLGVDNYVACADPVTGHDRAHVALPPRQGSTVYLIDLIYAGHRLFGSYHDGARDDALVVLTPPSQCLS